MNTEIKERVEVYKRQIEVRIDELRTETENANSNKGYEIQRDIEHRLALLGHAVDNLSVRPIVIKGKSPGQYARGINIANNIADYLSRINTPSWSKAYWVRTFGEELSDRRLNELLSKLKSPAELTPQPETYPEITKKPTDANG